MKINVLTFFKPLITSAAITGWFLASVCNVSCTSSPDELNILNGDYNYPRINSYSVTSQNEMEIIFSKPVELSAMAIFEKDNEYPCEANYDGNKAIIRFYEPTYTGKEYIAEGIATDTNGNSLTFSLNFTGFNNDPAKVILSEIRCSYGTSSVNKVKLHKTEFVELYVKKGGNLSGLEIVSANDGEELKYVLPAIEVKEGDYITVHMRKIIADGPDGEGMIDELEDDLTLSTHLDSCDTARDLWFDNQKAVFGDNDIIFIKDNIKGEIIDAVIFSKSDCTDWKESCQSVINQLKDTETWKGSFNPGEVINSDYLTSSATTRSLSRQKLDLPYNSKDQWMVVADSGSGAKKVPGPTPGTVNSSNEYKPPVK